MLGREDMVLEGTPNTDDVDRLLRPFRALWPDAVAVQADREADPVQLSTPEWTHVRSWAEFLVCRDSDALRSWATQVRTEENDGSMVHILVAPDSLTVVVDSSDSPTGRIVSQCFSALRFNRALHSVAKDHSPW